MPLTVGILSEHYANGIRNCVKLLSNGCITFVTEEESPDRYQLNYMILDAMRYYNNHEHWASPLFRDDMTNNNKEALSIRHVGHYKGYGPTNEMQTTQSSARTMESASA